MQKLDYLKENPSQTAGPYVHIGLTPNKLGTYSIRCAELCGLHHAYMETTITVVTQEQYDAWLREHGGKRTV